MFDCCLVVMNTQRLHFGHGFCSSVTSKRAAVTDAVAGSVTEGEGAFCVFICGPPGGCCTPGFWNANGAELYRININYQLYPRQIEFKIEFFKSTAVWNALGWDQEETCFYWQHSANKTVIRVHCDSLEVANREALSPEITSRRGSAKPLAKYKSDREGSALAVEKLQQSLHLVARLAAKPKTEAQSEADGSLGGVDVSAGGYGALVSGEVETAAGPT
jgi:hypothetical protein